MNKYHIILILFLILIIIIYKSNYETFYEDLISPEKVFDNLEADEIYTYTNDEINKYIREGDNIKKLFEQDKDYYKGIDGKYIKDMIMDGSNLKIIYSDDTDKSFDVKGDKGLQQSLEELGYDCSENSTLLKSNKGDDARNISDIVIDNKKLKIIFNNGEDKFIDSGVSGNNNNNVQGYTGDLIKYKTVDETGKFLVTKNNIPVDENLPMLQVDGDINIFDSNNNNYISVANKIDNLYNKSEAIKINEYLDNYINNNIDINTEHRSDYSNIDINLTDGNKKLIYKDTHDNILNDNEADLKSNLDYYISGTTRTTDSSGGTVLPDTTKQILNDYIIKPSQDSNVINIDSLSSLSNNTINTNNLCLRIPKPLDPEDKIDYCFGGEDNEKLKALILKKLAYFHKDKCIGDINCYDQTTFRGAPSRWTIDSKNWSNKYFSDKGDLSASELGAFTLSENLDL